MFVFKSFEEFIQVRIKAAQWRAFEQQLAGIEGEEIVRGVLLVPTNDRRTNKGKSDNSYEKRLYEGFKEAMYRLREGLPLEDDAPKKVVRPSAPQVPKRDKFREACVTLGYLPSEESIDQPQAAAVEDDVRSTASLGEWTPPSTPLAQPSPPPRSPFTPPGSPFSPPRSTFSSPKSTLSSPPTPRIPGCETFSPQPSTPDIDWLPTSPTPSQIECLQRSNWPSPFQTRHSPSPLPERGTPRPQKPKEFKKSKMGRPRKNAQSSLSSKKRHAPSPEKELPISQKPKRGRPRKNAQNPPPPIKPTKKYSKHQSKFSDEALEKVRSAPPRTRQARKNLSDSS